MKKIFLLIVCGLLCSCKSITYQDVNPQIAPNKELLPAMEALVDVYNLENIYSKGYSMTNSYSYGSGYAHNSGTVDTTHHAAHGNMNYSNSHYRGNSYMTTSSITSSKSSYYGDVRVSDAIRFFEKEVEENMTNPYGEKKGFILLKLSYREHDSSFFYPMLSFLTLYMVNCFGVPCDKATDILEVEVRIMNNKKELVRKYIENVSHEDYVAFWYGYDYEDVWRKVAADNIKEALEKIRVRIGRDAAEIKAKLAE